MANAPDHVIESLQFPEVQRESTPSLCDIDGRTATEESLTQCMLCEQEFPTIESCEEFKIHLRQEHSLAIRDRHLICDFRRYCDFWRKQFFEKDYRELCNKCEAIEEGLAVVYSLDPSIPEDERIREILQRRRLDAVLAVQQGERDDTSLSRSCLFCRETFNGNRAELFNHMAFSHSFNVGQPDNIVFANEFLDLLERTLEKLQCLYCEKIFRERMALKDHMRKKQHRKLNPNNKAYDRFYVINYLEAGKDWQEVQAEMDVAVESLQTENEESWADWDDDLQTNLVCLFCKHNSAQLSQLLEHMTLTHGFDFRKMTLDHDLNFYEQVKLVNFIRQTVHQSQCSYCPHKSESSQDLILHLGTHSDRMESGLEKAKWDQPQYLFPTYENDALLCSLEDFSSDDDKEDPTNSGKSSSSGIPILAEDSPITEESILFRESGVLESLKTGR